MEKKEAMVIGTAIALVLYTAVLGVLGPVMSAAQTNVTISNAGSVKTIGVGVFWDSALTNRVTSITWGLIDPGSSVDKIVYIKNEGNAASTLSMSKSNWNPSSASTYITLTWDYNGQTVNVGQSVQVKLTLAVSSSIASITNFTFDIVIVSTG